MLSKRGLTRNSHRKTYRKKNRKPKAYDPLLRNLKQTSNNIVEDMTDLDPRNRPYRDSTRQPESAYDDEDIDWDDLIGFDAHWD